ncbi:hypothetical protein [Mycolicibacterium sp. XJ1819]
MVNDPEQGVPMGSCDEPDEPGASSIDDGVWGGAGPEPWWFNHPELLALRRQALEEVNAAPDRPPCDEPDEPGEVGVESGVSSIDDGVGSDGVWGGVGPEPWWFNHPELLALRRQALEEVDAAPERPPYDEPDPILNDVLSGASRRELASARDDLERAQSRYTEAIRSARVCGLSWGEIGAVLGVARQLLHRRYAKGWEQSVD